MAKRAAEVEVIRNVEVARDVARDDLVRKGAEAGREMGYGREQYGRDSRDGGLNYGNSNGRGGYNNRGRGGYDNRSDNRSNNRARGGIGSDRRNEPQNSSNGSRDMGRVPTGPRGNGSRDDIKSESSSAPMEIDQPKVEIKSEIKSETDSKPPLPSDAPPPPPPSDMPPPPPPSSRPRSPTPPEVKLTLAEMAELQAKKMSVSATPAPLNASLNGLRYLGAKAVDKRKPRKTSDKKFVFDWDGKDDTGAGEVDPIYAPYIPKAIAKVDKHGRDSTYGIGRDDRTKAGPTSTAVVGMMNKVGMYGRGMLAGFDRELT